MKYILVVIGIIATLGSLVTCSAAKSAVHEIEALMEFLIGLIALAAAALLHAIDNLKNKVP